MNKSVFFASVAATALAFTACTHNASQQVELTPAQALVQRLDTLRQHGYMYGHQDDPFYGITWQWDRNGRSDTKELVGDYPAVMGFELGGLEKGDAANLDSVPFDWMRDEIIAHHERGGIITISWHPRNPLNGRTAWIESDLKEYNEQLAQGIPADSLIDPKQTVASTLVGGEKHELFMDWLDRVATFIGSCKDAQGNAIPVIFRPWHENTGSWFWWGEGNCTAEDYKALWNMTQDYIEERLPGQLIWSYSPSPRSIEHFLERWPGDDRVQLLGVDAYQWGSEEDFMKGLAFGLDLMDEYVKDHPMLIAVTECGRVNSDIPDWWTRVFHPIASQHKICYCLPWRNWPAEHFGASKDVPTAEDFKAYAALPETLFLNDIK